MRLLPVPSPPPSTPWKILAKKRKRRFQGEIRVVERNAAVFKYIAILPHIYPCLPFDGTKLLNFSSFFFSTSWTSGFMVAKPSRPKVFKSSLVMDERVPCLHLPAALAPNSSEILRFRDSHFLFFFFFSLFTFRDSSLTFNVQKEFFCRIQPSILDPRWIDVLKIN